MEELVQCSFCGKEVAGWFHTDCGHCICFDCLDGSKDMICLDCEFERGRE